MMASIKEDAMATTKKAAKRGKKLSTKKLEQTKPLTGLNYGKVEWKYSNQ